MRKHEASRGVRVDPRLHARHEILNPVLSVIEGLAGVPAQSIVNGQIGSNFVGILGIYPEILGAGIQQLEAGLVKQVRRAQ